MNIDDALEYGPNLPTTGVKHRRRIDELVDDLIRKSYRQSLQHGDIYAAESRCGYTEFEMPQSIGPDPCLDLRRGLSLSMMHAKQIYNFLSLAGGAGLVR